MSNISSVPVANQENAAAQTKRSPSVESSKSDQTGTAAGIKQQLNVQILEISVKTSIQSGNDSQALLFRSAIDRINEFLAPELGDNAIQGMADEDASPEATAERILSLSTGFFDAYAAQHPDSSPEQLATDFVELIRGGFEKGFQEAADILDGLGVFDGDIKDGIMKTYDLVSKGYDDFLASKLQPSGETKSPTEAT